MPKEQILSAEKLKQKFEHIKAKYQKQYNTQIPYFKRIIEELQKITKVEDIDGVINKLSKYEQYCRNNKEKYNDGQFMPIIVYLQQLIFF